MLMQLKRTFSTVYTLCGNRAAGCVRRRKRKKNYIRAPSAAGGGRHAVCSAASAACCDSLPTFWGTERASDWLRAFQRPTFRSRLRWEFGFDHRFSTNCDLYPIVLARGFLTGCQQMRIPQKSPDNTHEFLITALGSITRCKK